MKENDIVTLIKLKKEYADKNLYLNIHGVVIKILANDLLQVIFFNDKMIGDYAVIEVHKTDVKKCEEKLPFDFVKEIKQSKKVDFDKVEQKKELKLVPFNEYDVVELLVEKEIYAKHGIHKGASGCVMDDNAVDNFIEVDFSGIDENGNYYGDCISVKIDDLKKLW